MANRVLNVLFLCTGNSARSIIAEAILNHEGNGRFRAFSAGSTPRGEVHPLTLQVLRSFNYPTDGLRSKSWSEFSAPGAPEMDLVFTVCDTAAGEACPVWPGQPMTAHWGIDDPVAVQGAETTRIAAFVTATRYLKNRISVLIALPFDKLDSMALSKRLHEIGAMEGASGQKPQVA